MERIFKNFSDLATSAIAERFRAIQADDRSGSAPGEGVDESTQATVRVTAVDGPTESSAHITLTHSAE
jgi:hypothetical protein